MQLERAVGNKEKFESFQCSIKESKIFQLRFGLFNSVLSNFISIFPTSCFSNRPFQFHVSQNRVELKRSQQTTVDKILFHTLRKFWPLNNIWSSLFEHFDICEFFLEFFLIEGFLDVDADFQNRLFLDSYSTIDFSLRIKICQTVQMAQNETRRFSDFRISP